MGAAPPAAAERVQACRERLDEQELALYCPDSAPGVQAGEHHTALPKRYTLSGAEQAALRSSAEGESSSSRAPIAGSSHSEEQDVGRHELSELAKAEFEDTAKRKRGRLFKALRNIGKSPVLDH
eukprot:SM000206S06274  [mRNA]  locus=s206:128528:129437:+ [translate_table: standard]